MRGLESDLARGECRLHLIDEFLGAAVFLDVGVGIRMDHPGDLEDVIMQLLQRGTVDRLVVRDPVTQHPDFVETGMNVLASPVPSIRKSMLQAGLPERCLVAQQRITRDPGSCQSSPEPKRGGGNDLVASRRRGATSNQRRDRGID